MIRIPRVAFRAKPLGGSLGSGLSPPSPSFGLSFGEARGDILLVLANEKRGLNAERLTDMLSTATHARFD